MIEYYKLDEQSIVVCVKNYHDKRFLTIGKHYIVEESYHNVGIYVVDDEGTYKMYDYGNFRPIDMYRNDIIDEILE